MHFISSLFWEVFGQRMLRYILFSLAWNGFGQHKRRSIMCPRWHWISLVNTSLDIFCVLPRHGICLFNTSSDIFYTLAGMRGMFDTR